LTRRRGAILAEMGLGPVWRLRAPRTAEAAGPADEPEPGAAGVQDAGAGADEREPGILALDWPALREAVVACTACGLHSTRSQTVFGVGDPSARWLLVGEAPGAEEDRLGEPFVGQAGKLLDNMLAALGLRRGRDVYIANVLKCRPPGNRNPEAGEIAQCTPYLLRQIQLIRPKLIVAMGRFAAQTLLHTDATIARLRGQTHRFAGVPLVVTYHPAYLLRNLPDKAKAWADLVYARATLSALERTAE